MGEPYCSSNDMHINAIPRMDSGNQFADSRVALSLKPGSHLSALSTLKANAGSVTKPLVSPRANGSVCKLRIYSSVSQGNRAVTSSLKVAKDCRISSPR